MTLACHRAFPAMDHTCRALTRRRELLPRSSTQSTTSSKKLSLCGHFLLVAECQKGLAASTSWFPSRWCPYPGMNLHVEYPIQDSEAPKKSVLLEQSVQELMKHNNNNGRHGSTLTYKDDHWCTLNGTVGTCRYCMLRDTTWPDCIHKIRFCTQIWAQVRWNTLHHHSHQTCTSNMGAAKKSVSKAITWMRLSTLTILPPVDCPACCLCMPL